MNVFYNITVLFHGSGHYLRNTKSYLNCGRSNICKLETEKFLIRKFSSQEIWQSSEARKNQSDWSPPVVDREEQRRR